MLRQEKYRELLGAGQGGVCSGFGDLVSLPRGSDTSAET